MGDVRRTELGLAVIKRLALLLLVATSCSASLQPEWIEGGLYSVREQEGGQFVIVKILELDGKGVHVCGYWDRFDSRPVDIDETALQVSLGAEHFPLLPATFASWEPQYIKTVPVEWIELEAYDNWILNEGDYY